MRNRHNIRVMSGALGAGSDLESELGAPLVSVGPLHQQLAYKTNVAHHLELKSQEVWELSFKRDKCLKYLTCYIMLYHVINIWFNILSSFINVILDSLLHMLQIPSNEFPARRRYLCLFSSYSSNSSAQIKRALRKDQQIAILLWRLFEA